MDNPLQKVVCDFLRLITGCHAHTSRWALLLDFGLMPLQTTWACLCARFWNKERASSSIAGRTLSADMQLFAKGSNLCWTARFLHAMATLGMTHGRSYTDMQTCGATALAALHFDESNIKLAYMNHYQHIHHGVPMEDPRSAASRGAMLTKYLSWFHDTTSTAHMNFSMSEHLMKCLFRFRLGSTTSLRCNNHQVNRQDRTCTICRGAHLEDEKHVLFECTAYDHVRSEMRWRHLFTDNKALSMRTFMNQKDQYLLACFINHIMHVRTSLLATPRRPRAPIHAPRSLDMFDSSEDEA